MKQQSNPIQSGGPPQCEAGLQVELGLHGIIITPKCFSNSRRPATARRVVKNVCAMACGDHRDTPSAAGPDPPEDEPDQAAAPAANGASDANTDPEAAAASVARQACDSNLVVFVCNRPCLGFKYWKNSTCCQCLLQTRYCLHCNSARVGRIVGSTEAAQQAVIPCFGEAFDGACRALRRHYRRWRQFDPCTLSS